MQRYRKERSTMKNRASVILPFTIKMDYIVICGKGFSLLM